MQRSGWTRVVAGLCAAALTTGVLALLTSQPAAADVGSTIVANAQKYLGDDYTGAGWPESGPAQEAWCADFLRRIWHDSGVKGADEITPAAGSAWLYGVAHNTLTVTPSVGAAIIFNDAVGANPTSVADHVAIVTKVNANGTIESIGGNENGSNEWNGRVVHDGPYPGGVGKPFGSSTTLFISGYAAPDNGSTPVLNSVFSSGGRLGYLRSVSSTATANGTTYVSTELGYTGSLNGILRARSGSVGPWEKYLLVYNDDGTASLMSTANGKLHARSDVVGPWEEFTMVSDNGAFALRSAHQYNGMLAYVSAELGYDKSYSLYGELRARNGSIGDWERFQA